MPRACPMAYCIYGERVHNYHQIVTKLGGPIKPYSHVAGRICQKIAVYSLSILSTIMSLGLPSFRSALLFYRLFKVSYGAHKLSRASNDILHGPRLFIRLVKNALQFSSAALLAGYHSSGYGGLHHRRSEPHSFLHIWMGIILQVLWRPVRKF